MSKLFYVSFCEPYREHTARIVKELDQHGWSASYDWTLGLPELLAEPVPDDAAMGELASRRMAGVMDADVFIMLLPTGRDAHVELGVALALGKAVLLVYGDPGMLSCRTPLDGAFYRAAGIEHWNYYGQLHVSLLAARLDKLLLAKLQEVANMVSNPVGGDEDEEPLKEQEKEE
jgi:hypothetical protein